MTQDPRASRPSSFLGALHPATDEDGDLGWVPRRGPRPTTATSAAFGGLEVGPPVSRLAVPAPGQAPAPAPAGPARAAVAAQRCPSCGARTRPEESWCSLCHTSLLPAPVPPTTPATSATPATPAPGPAPSRPARVVEDDGGQLALDLGAPAGTPGRPALDEAEVERMLGALSRQGGTGLRGLGSRRAKVLVAAGGAAGLTALLLAGTAVLGSVLG
ncbi:hypothetical protein AB2L28_00600 [Kineococcus sp. TBRC 1896]|uniref:Zinc ribbon domain-containing protein n=1 Tax=Kineococcus mangrovi TaxID=1660183 RepID=A0ABV4HZF3_9ACTN